MPRLIWSPAALRDVQRLYRFLAAKNPGAASRAVRAIREGVQVIADQPAIGRPLDDVPDYREWLIGFGDSGYVVLYRLTDADGIILAIRHKREAGY